MIATHVLQYAGQVWYYRRKPDGTLEGAPCGAQPQRITDVLLLDAIREEEERLERKKREP